MELLFSTLLGAAIGALVNYTVPGRHTYGSALIPATSAALTSAVWVGLLWLGWKFDGGWIWAVSLVAAGVLALVLALVLPRKRTGDDARMLQRLSKASTVSKA
jgi:hypothetical protein